jgi:hypothetical protein
MCILPGSMLKSKSWIPVEVSAARGVRDMKTVRVVLLATWFAALALAQSQTAQIIGTIKDQSGTVIADTSQFILPPAYSLGSVGRTLPDVRGPSLTNFDLSLSKNLKLRERLTAQFRFEYFNVFNTPHFWMPNTGMGSLQFGRITATTALARVGQMGLKLVF